MPRTLSFPAPRIVLAVLCAIAAVGAADAQTRHQLKLHLPGLAVSGNVAAPVSQQLQLSSTAIDFGDVATNTLVKRQVLASNLGGTSLSFRAAPAVTGSAAFGAGLTSCGATLAVGAECLAEVLFSPTLVGAHSGLLSFTTSLAGSPHKVSLAANAFNPVSLAAASLPAGTVGQAYTYDFKSLLGVSNEASPDKSQATWSGSGTLPTGLTLNSSTGVLSGTPTTPAANAPYTVVATYKNNQGQQVYTLRIGSIYLEAVQVSAGGYHTCAVTPSGGVKCWGYNAQGQLGDGTNTTRATPVAVAGLSSGVSNIATGLYHTCAVTAAGATKCWGYNGYSQLGYNTSSYTQNLPGDVANLGSGVAKVIAGESHNCALTTSGGLKCWGLNNFGQLGDGTVDTSMTPAEVSGLSAGVSDVSAGGWFTCAVTAAGAVKCWGFNSQGQLGDGTYAAKRTPTNVAGLTTGAAQVSVGYEHACAVTAAGAVKCWGNNGYGRLGDGTNTSSATPVAALGLASGVSGIASGLYHTCAVTTTGAAKCWGNNGYDQLGDGTSNGRTTPTDVAGLTVGVASISAGYYHTCATLLDSSTKCWGGNYYGQLGDSTGAQRPAPVDVMR